jgi:hypothetical protein
MLLFPAAGAAPATETPLVPIISFLRHWDHHWYVWLRGDPVYEAVEVMAAERGRDAGPLVWVFFTERDGPKHQVHYYNDARVAAALGANFRDIAFTMGGAVGAPRDIDVRFTDGGGRPVALEIRSGPNTQLVTQGAGLTNQMGHSGDRMLLVFFREKNAFAQAAHVTIAGVDVATPQPGQNHPAPFSAAYSANIFASGFPFRDQRVNFTNDGGDADAIRFAPSSRPGQYFAVLPDTSQIELAASDGDLEYYRHRNGEHLLEIRFRPPLPRTDRRDIIDVDSAFRISLDGFHDLLTGSVHVSRQSDRITLDWRYEVPVWAQAKPLRSTVYISDGAMTRLELRPLVRP